MCSTHLIGWSYVTVVKLNYLQPLRVFILFVAPRKALASCRTVTTNNMKLMWLINVTLKAL